MGRSSAYTWTTGPVAQSMATHPTSLTPSIPQNGARARSTTTSGGLKLNVSDEPATPPGTAQWDRSSVFSGSSVGNQSNINDISDNDSTGPFTPHRNRLPLTPGTGISDYTPPNKHVTTNALDRHLLSPNYLSSPSPAPSRLASTHRQEPPTTIPPSFSYDVSTSYTFRRPPRSRTHERCNPFFHQHARARRAPPHCFDYDSSYLRACYAPPRVRSMGCLVGDRVRDYKGDGSSS